MTSLDDLDEWRTREGQIVARLWRDLYCGPGAGLEVDDPDDGWVTRPGPDGR